MFILVKIQRFPRLSRKEKLLMGMARVFLATNLDGSENSCTAQAAGSCHGAECFSIDLSVGLLRAPL